MKPIYELPEIYLLGSSLHLLLGNFFTSTIYHWRFGSSPLKIQRGRPKSRHMLYTQIISWVAVIWSLQLVLTAYSIRFRDSFLGRPVFGISPILGWTLGISGLLGMLYFQYQMGRSFRIGQEVDMRQEKSSLVTHGIYQWTRNPIYLFSTLSLFGFTLWSPSLGLIGAWILLALCIHQLVLEEEKFLHQRFGTQYETFVSQVPRYFDLGLGLGKGGKRDNEF